jgi:hypothetical protein
MTKFHQGIYNPKNIDKYIGKKIPTFRSGWEQNFMIFLDNHPSVTGWASEPFSVPYYDMISGKQKNYWPDFFLSYKDKDGKTINEIVEIKPKAQSVKLSPDKKRTKSSKLLEATIIRNQCKWASCKKWCEERGYLFRVLTEEQLFGYNKDNKK